jgi:O-antigen ligase
LAEASGAPLAAAGAARPGGGLQPRHSLRRTAAGHDAAVLHETPIRSKAAFAMGLAIFFLITYFETVNLAGLKVATLWRLVVVILAALVIAVRPFARHASTRELEPVFWAFLAFAVAPLLGIGVGSADVQVSLEVFAQRIFPIVVVMFLLAACRFDLADLLVRAFPVYLCLVSVPLLLGLLPPPSEPLAAVSGYDLNAYIGPFQNIHSAALAHAIAVICTFTLLARAGAGHRLVMLGVALACFALTVLTTARSGVLAAVVGMAVIAWLAGRFRALLSLVALAALLAVAVAAMRPQVVDVAVDRALGRNAYVVDYSADAMSSGRLTLQKAALQAYAEQPLMRQLFGIGRTESKKAIERYTSFYLIAHNAYVDELIAYGLFGLLALLAALATAFRLAWRNARASQPAGFALLLALALFATLQGVDYSLQLSVMGLVLLLETHARVRTSERAVAARRREA